MRYIYMVVEGQHDAAAIGRLLSLTGLKLITNLKKIDVFWKRLIPEKFPHLDNLLKRMPVPFFYQSEDVSIAIHPSEGDSNLIKTLNTSLQNIDQPELLSAIALFRDADNLCAKESFENLKQELEKQLEVSLVKEQLLSLQSPGDIVGEGLKVGIYIFPDNTNDGYLEHLLIEGAEISYPSLLQNAREYIYAVDTSYKENWKTSSERKVLVGCISNVLKPGKSNQVSIQDNDWFSEASIGAKPSILQIRNFILNLIN